VSDHSFHSCQSRRWRGLVSAGRRGSSPCLRGAGGLNADVTGPPKSQGKADARPQWCYWCPARPWACVYSRSKQRILCLKFSSAMPFRCRKEPTYRLSDALTLLAWSACADPPFEGGSWLAPFIEDRNKRPVESWQILCLKAGGIPLFRRKVRKITRIVFCATFGCRGVWDDPSGPEIGQSRAGHLLPLG
jgi:hypothetical protein